MAHTSTNGKKTLAVLVLFYGCLISQFRGLVDETEQVDFDALISGTPGFEKFEAFKTGAEFLLEPVQGFTLKSLHH